MGGMWRGRGGRGAEDDAPLSVIPPPSTDLSPKERALRERAPYAIMLLYPINRLPAHQ